MSNKIVLIDYEIISNKLAPNIAPTRRQNF